MAIAIILVHVGVFTIRGVNGFFLTHSGNINQKAIEEIKITTKEMAKQIKLLNEKGMYMNGSIKSGHNNSIVNGNVGILDNRNKVYINLNGVKIMNIIK